LKKGEKTPNQWKGKKKLLALRGKIFLGTLCSFLLKNSFFASPSLFNALPINLIGLKRSQKEWKGCGERKKVRMVIEAQRL